MEYKNKRGKLEDFLVDSEFNRQLNSFGKDVFSMLLNLYCDTKVSKELDAIFPEDKKEAFEKVSREVAADNGKNMRSFYHYLSEFDDKPVKALLGSQYGEIIRKRDSVVKSLGYEVLYNGFVKAQAKDLLMEEEGDSFFYINDKKFKSLNKDSEKIWVFAKVVELLYDE